ncbi:CG34291, partial [Drosophila busckii]
MNFSWLSVFIFALIAVVVSAGKCPAHFTKDGNRCVTDRPVHGECPQGSKLEISINKCVHNS